LAYAGNTFHFIMQEKITVIFIISFPPTYESVTMTSHVPEKTWVNKKGEIIAVWKEDWGHTIGNRVLAQAPELHFEVWRPDYRADAICKYTFKSGLVHYSFPAKFIYARHGLKYHKNIYSELLIDKLTQLKDGNENVVIILPVARGLMVRKIIRLFHDSIPMIHPNFVSNDMFLNIIPFQWNLFKYLHRVLLQKELAKIVLKDSYLTLISRKGMEEIKNKYSKNTFLINTGFDPSDWPDKISRKSAREKLNLEENIPIILSSSRLVREKQIAVLINVLAKFKDYSFKCFITGNGTTEYINHLRNVIKENDLQDKVFLTGFVSREELGIYYCASDVFIMTSTKEAGPASTAIAVIYDIPIITTDTGLLYEILEEHKAGVIIPAKDHEKWPKAIETFLKKEAIPLLSKEDFLKTGGVYQNMNKLIELINQISGKRPFSGN
jgi:glycosyltransferase involved in cell wall biosynthesis